MIERVPTGIENFDSLIEGGFPRGDVTLLSGGPGSGKTIFAAQFLYNGAMKFREKGIFVSFRERRNSFLRNMLRIGMNFSSLEKQGLVKFLDLLPTRAEGFSSIFMLIEEEITYLGAKRVAIDPFTAMSQMPQEEADRIMLQTILHKMLKATGCTMLLPAELPAGAIEIGKGIEEFVVDGVITLEAEIGKGFMNRFLTIRKMRSTNHAQGKLAFMITDDGCKILPPATQRR